MQHFFDERAVVAVGFVGQLEPGEVHEAAVHRDARRAVDDPRADVQGGAVGQLEAELVLRTGREAIGGPDPEPPEAEVDDRNRLIVGQPAGLQAAGDRRALIGNYQKLGLFEPGMLEVLAPRRGFRAYHCDPATFSLTPEPPAEDYRRETIAYYQTASYLYRTGGYKALTPAEQAAWREDAGREASVPTPASPPLAAVGSAAAGSE